MNLKKLFRRKHKLTEYECLKMIRDFVREDRVEDAVLSMYYLIDLVESSNANDVVLTALNMIYQQEDKPLLTPEDLRISQELLAARGLMSKG